MNYYEYIKYIINKIIKKLNPKILYKSKISSKSKIGSGTELVNSIVDKYSYIGSNCLIIHTEIGKYTSIASNVIIGGAQHPIDWVSTSPIFIEGKNILKINYSSNYFQPFKNTTIENDVWIGANVIIKSGIKIGNGAIIGMGSVVTKDVNPYCIVAGNPARIIRYRFNNDIIDKLSESKWWEYDDKELKNLGKYFNNVNEFLRYISNERKI